MDKRTIITRLRDISSNAIDTAAAVQVCTEAANALVSILQLQRYSATEFVSNTQNVRMVPSRTGEVLIHQEVKEIIDNA